METRAILRRIYPESVGDRRRRRRLWPLPPGLTAALRALSRRVEPYAWRLATAVLFVMLWVGTHFYYYNVLVDLEYNVQAAWAQVEAQLQRRYHIQQNLTRIMVDYARHERELFTVLTKLRVEPSPAQAGASLAPSVGPPAPEVQGPDTQGALASLRATPTSPGASISAREFDELFTRLQVVAEQYPQLRLSENFQQFSTAIVETESAIAEQTSAYNDAVNLYSTRMKQYPARFFARLSGFEEYEFFSPKKAALGFEHLEFQVPPQSTFNRTDRGD